ncbi:MAG: hypothetical protein PHS49_01205 [Candidatus Gracilibacteria bacterium]|nr:hypothetical protein [Candidatus Gracilibacteria bacterium]
MRTSSLNNGLKTYNYTYDAVGNITNDNHKTYSYDDIYRIKQITDTNTTTLLESFDYDNLGNRINSYNQSTGSGANYDYATNNLNQYTTLSGSILSYQLQEIIETTTSSGTTETSSGTTESGSRTTESGSGTTETGSGTTETGSGTTTGTGETTTTTITYTGSLVTTNENIDYLYDNNGNLKQDNKYKYYYDYKNRLVKATNLVDETIVEFSYDVLNRRFQKTTSEKVINYV